MNFLLKYTSPIKFGEWASRFLITDYIRMPQLKIYSLLNLLLLRQTYFSPRSSFWKNRKKKQDIPLFINVWLINILLPNRHIKGSRNKFANFFSVNRLNFTAWHKWKSGYVVIWRNGWENLNWFSRYDHDWNYTILA